MMMIMIIMMMLMMMMMMMWLTMAANFQSASAAPDTSSSRILSVMTLISCTQRLVSCHVLSTLRAIATTVWVGSRVCWARTAEHVRQSCRSAQTADQGPVAEAGR